MLALTLTTTAALCLLIFRLRKWRSSENLAQFIIVNRTAVTVSVQIISHLLSLLQLTVIYMPIPSTRYLHLSKILYSCRNKALFQSIFSLAFVKAKLTSLYIGNIFLFYCLEFTDWAFQSPSYFHCVHLTPCCSLVWFGDTIVGKPRFRYIYSSTSLSNINISSLWDTDTSTACVTFAVFGNHITRCAPHVAI
jgi:hypothetical protein